MQARRSIAGVLIALTIGVALEPLFHSDAGHDPHFAIELHDASQHRFTAPAPDERPLRVAAAPFAMHLHADDPGRLAAGSAVPLPARAPPARS